MTVVEHTLVLRARSGDDSAWAALFELVEPTVRARVAARLPAALRRKVGVDDVLQEARLVAFRRFAEFEDRGDGAFEAWFARIAELKLRELVRRFLGTAKRAGTKEVSRGGRPDTAAFAAHGPSPSEGASDGESRRRTLRALDALSEDHRTILRLVQFEGLTLALAADRMGRSREAAKKLYGRALTKLGEALDVRRPSG